MKNKVRKILVQLSETGLVCLAESLFNHCNYLHSSICKFLDLGISSTRQAGGPYPSSADTRTESGAEVIVAPSFSPNGSPKSFSCLQASPPADSAQLLEDKDLSLRTCEFSTRAYSSPDLDDDRESNDDLLAYTG